MKKATHNNKKRSKAISAGKTIFQAAGLCFLLAAICLVSVTACAQVKPDAGSVLQETRQPEIQPGPEAEDIIPRLDAAAEVQPGGPQVDVKAVIFTGNTIFSQDELASVVADYINASYDLAGLRQIAERVSAFYRDNGYHYARAYISEQEITDGVLTIDIIEGCYGHITATGDPALAAWAQRFLCGLKPGCVIEEKCLERSILIFGDQPGIEVSPLICPGESVGLGDLEVQVMQGPRFSGQVRLDNHGNRYSGEYRGEV